MASVLAALRRSGAAPRFAETPGDIREAGHVMLPGVGSFGAAMEMLERTGMAAPLRERMARGRPTLSVCVGLQLLCSSSEESPGVAGLRLVDQPVRRYPDAVRSPQFGWNTVEPGAECATIEAGHAYFANSYRLAAAPGGWSVAMSDHGGPFVAAMEQGAVVACQFHPELSGAYGRALLDRWVAMPC